jgi:glycosyltransferase involved in cell wall biosynthesis
MSKYRIALDISPTLDGNKVRGVGFYTKHLIDALQSEIVANPDYRHFTISLIDKPQSLNHYNLVHYPYFDPFRLTLPPQRSIPTIVTVHDLTPIQFPQHYPKGIKGQIKWWQQKHRLSQVDFIITDSHYSKYSIHQLTSYPLDRIYPIYLAADSRYQPRSSSQLKNIAQKYQLPSKFILYIGDIGWNKNIPSLVKSCLKLKYPLVIVGSSATKAVTSHPETQDILWLQAIARQYPQLVRLTGFVPDEDLPYFYNLATLYCQPSFAEGFGLPALEALQSGCPLIYADTTSLSEVVNHCGLRFNPNIPAQLVTALKRLWTTPKLRQKYTTLGLDRSHFFNWQFTARQTLAVYQLACLYDQR